MVRSACLLSLVTFALAAVGCGGAVQREAATPAEVAPGDTTTKIVGASSAQEKVLREILAGLRPSRIERVVIEPAGPDWTPFHPNSVVINIDYVRPDENSRGEWEAELLGEAFEEQSRERALPPVAAMETPGDGIALDGPDESPPDRSSISGAAVATSISAAAKAAGIELVEARILQPDRVAADVTLRVSDPARSLKHRVPKFLSELARTWRDGYAGLYVRVIDLDGRFVWMSAAAESSAIGASTHKARPSLAGCDPIPLIGPPDDYSPPACPAE